MHDINIPTILTVNRYNMFLFHTVQERKHPIKKTVTKGEVLKSLQYDMIRKELELFALKKTNLRLQNKKLKMEIHGLKRG